MAGKKAQTELKKNYEKNINALMQKEKKFKRKKKNNSTKKVLSQDEYKNQVEKLRSKVSSLQKREDLYYEISIKKEQKQKMSFKKFKSNYKRIYARKENKNSLDKKSLLLADENLDITNDIMSLLNKKLKSIK